MFNPLSHIYQFHLHDIDIKRESYLDFTYSINTNPIILCNGDELCERFFEKSKHEGPPINIKITGTLWKHTNGIIWIHTIKWPVPLFVTLTFMWSHVYFAAFKVQAFDWCKMKQIKYFYILDVEYVCGMSFQKDAKEHDVILCTYS